MSESSATAVMPMITVDSVDATREFYVERLGFEHQMGVVGKDGQLDFCNVVLENASLMFTRAEQPEGDARPERQRVELYLGVRDVDGYYEKVRSRGVEVVETPTEQWWGDRTFVIRDPNHYRVWFYTHVGDPVPPAGTKIV